MSLLRMVEQEYVSRKQEHSSVSDYFIEEICENSSGFQVICRIYTCEVHKKPGLEIESMEFFTYL